MRQPEESEMTSKASQDFVHILGAILISRPFPLPPMIPESEIGAPLSGSEPPLQPHPTFFKTLHSLSNHMFPAEAPASTPSSRPQSPTTPFPPPPPRQPETTMVPNLNPELHCLIPTTMAPSILLRAWRCYLVTAGTGRR